MTLFKDLDLPTPKELIASNKDSHTHSDSPKISWPSHPQKKHTPTLFFLQQNLKLKNDDPRPCRRWMVNCQKKNRSLENQFCNRMSWDPIRPADSATGRGKIQRFDETSGSQKDARLMMKLTFDRRRHGIGWHRLLGKTLFFAFFLVKKKKHHHHHHQQQQQQGGDCMVVSGFLLGILESWSLSCRL